MVGKAPKTAKPIPGVAESWTFSKDGKQITFKLARREVEQRGRRYRARFRLFLDETSQPRDRRRICLLRLLLQGRPRLQSAQGTGSFPLGFTAIDDFTLLVTLEHPTPFFLSLLFHHSLYPVHRATVEKFGAKWTRPEHFVGNGPFVLAEWKVNQVIRLKKNPLYWDQRNVRLDEADFFPIDKMAAEEAMFRSGALDVTNDIPLEKLEIWQEGSPGGVYQEYPYLGTYFYWLNVTRPPLDNKLVRKALALAIDREKIVKYVTRGGQRPGTSFSPARLAARVTTPPAVLTGRRKCRRDGEKATCRSGISRWTGISDGRASVQYQRDREENRRGTAGDVEAEPAEFRFGFSTRSGKFISMPSAPRTFQICRGSWIGDYDDPNTFLEIFKTAPGPIRPDGLTHRMTSCLQVPHDEPDPRKRMEYLRRAEALLLEELPVIPIYLSTKVYLKSPRVSAGTRTSRMSTRSSS